MAETLCSVGLDVGTTTTQLIVSKLTAENRASSFAVPRMEITDRCIAYKSPVHFTPLLTGELVDGEKLRQIVEKEYAAAGITPQQVDTGAVIVTGETSRKENARSVLAALSAYAGEFVVATAGPELESVLAAQGAGAVAYSKETGKTVLHIDIGGGTSNLARLEKGKVTAVGCLNVGGRLLKLDPTGRISYVSPVLKSIISHKEGDTLTYQQAMQIAKMLAGILEMAAGKREKDALFSRFITPGTQPVDADGDLVVSFSGGVADCIGKDVPWLSYGDLGPLLGSAIRESRLCSGQYRLGSQTIRATVIGAGCHSTQLSGSTVFVKDTQLPMKNLPVAQLTQAEQALTGDALSACIQKKLEGLDRWGVLYLPGWNAPDYETVTQAADAISRAVGQRPCYIALREDMAKALGHALALRLPEGTPCLCIDGVHIPPQSYLDVGAMVGPAIAVVVKTLVFEK